MINSALGCNVWRHKNPKLVVRNGGLEPCSKTGDCVGSFGQILEGCFKGYVKSNQSRTGVRRKIEFKESYENGICREKVNL